MFEQIARAFSTIRNVILNVLSGPFSFMLSDSNALYDSALSAKLSSFFVDTKVNVYIIKTHNEGIFTIPGYSSNNKLFSNFFSTILSNDVKAVFKFIPFQVITIFYLSLNSLFNVIAGALQLGTQPITVYDNGTAKLNCHEVTTYISSVSYNTLTPEERIAVLLHEVGHNTILFSAGLISCANICTTVINIRVWLELFKCFSDYQNAGKHLKIVISGFLMLTAAWFTISIISKKQEFHSDKLAARLGYGKYLNSALPKISNNSKKRYPEVMQKRIDIGEKKEQDTAIKFRIKSKDSPLTALMKFLGEYIYRAINSMYPTHPSNYERIARIRNTTIQRNKKQSEQSEKITKGVSTSIPAMIG